MTTMMKNTATAQQPLHRRPPSQQNGGSGPTKPRPSPPNARPRRRRLRSSSGGSDIGSSLESSFLGRGNKLVLYVIALTVLVLFVSSSLLLHRLVGGANDEATTTTADGPGQTRNSLRRSYLEGGEESGDGGANADGERRHQKRHRRDRAQSSLDDLNAYRAIRAEYDALYPPGDAERMRSLAASLRKSHSFRPIAAARDAMNYDVFNCPPEPPEGYPMAWPVLDVVSQNWNPDDVTPHEEIYQGLCVFDHAKDYDKAETYRRAEKPFVIRDDPAVLQAVERWADPSYLQRILQSIKSHKEWKTEHSASNHFMWWKLRDEHQRPKGWVEPNDVTAMSYDDWRRKAELAETKGHGGVNEEHWYFRLNADYQQSNPGRFMYDELPFFKPDEEGFYMVDPEDQRGINCRFGMKGVIAENHFDSSRNFIALLGGQRRYVLAHPDQCINLCLHPNGHPSVRHSAVDWSDPDLETYPQFKNARVNEVVLQAGDVLYLPTYWFHYIINLGLNYQCNARSGITHENRHFMDECGFPGV